MVLLSFLAWNNGLCLLLSGCLNCLLIWLLLKRTPSEMKVYSRILFQTAFVDVVMSLLNALVQPVLLADHNSAFLHISGPLVRDINLPWARFLLADFWLFTFFSSGIGLLIQFLYRYLVLVRNRNISLGRYVFWLGLASLTLLSVCIGLYFTSCPKEGNNDRVVNEQFARILDMDADQPIPAAILLNSSDSRFVVQCVGTLFVLNISSYAIIVFCAWRMVKFVAKNAREMVAEESQKRALELNRQLTRTLIIMAFMPFVMMCANLWIGVSILFVPADARGHQFSPASNTLAFNFGFALEQWVSVLNPLATIFTVKAYRNSVLLLFNCFKWGNVSPE